MSKTRRQAPSRRTGVEDSLERKAYRAFKFSSPKLHSCSVCGQPTDRETWSDMEKTRRPCCVSCQEEFSEKESENWRFLDLLMDEQDKEMRELMEEKA